MEENGERESLYQEYERELGLRRAFPGILKDLTVRLPGPAKEFCVLHAIEDQRAALSARLAKKSVAE